MRNGLFKDKAGWAYIRDGERVLIVTERDYRAQACAPHYDELPREEPFGLWRLRADQTPGREMDSLLACPLK